MITQEGRDTSRQGCTRRGKKGKKKKKNFTEVEDKITGSLGKSHEKIERSKSKMENQRHGRWQPRR